MAKGRKLTASRSERLLGSYAYGDCGNGEPEFGEDDVWSMVEDEAAARDEHAPVTESGGVDSVRRSRPVNWHAGGLSQAFDDSKTAQPRIIHQFRGNGVTRGGERHVASSAPVNVPDWSKILRVDSVGSLHDSDCDFDDGSETEIVPPHEFLARAHSRKTAANSVFEGVGRTLKGRDMTRVRDAVWRQTGFDG